MPDTVAKHFISTVSVGSYSLPMRVGTVIYPHFIDGDLDMELVTRSLGY